MHTIAESTGRRSSNAELNLVPFIDILFVTIAFLVITAVWTTNSQIPASPVAGKEGNHASANARLHVYLKGDTVRFAWRSSGTTLSERLVPVDDAELARAAQEEWALRGSHRSESDLSYDEVVVHVDDRTPHGQIIRLMDSLASPKRDVALPDGRRLRVPAFSLSLGTGM